LEKAEEKLAKIEERNKALSKVTLSLAENGSIQAVDAFGEPISRAEIKLMWEQQAATISHWLEKQADDINGEAGLLENIHLDTPDPSSISKYQPREYYESKPKRPKIKHKPTKKEIPSLGFFESLFKSKRETYKNQIEKAETKYKQELAKWHERQFKLIKEYEETLEKWEKEKEKFDKKEEYYKENFHSLVNENMEFMEENLESILNGLSWPRETIISYEIDDGGETVWVDIDLPEIEDMPQKIATIAASGKKLNIKNKAKKQLQLEYAKHIHGIAFKVVGTIFTVLPKVKRIIVSGYSQRLDSSIGKINDDYLYSFKIDREKFLKIKFNILEQVDPVAALDVFEHRKKMTTTGIFKPIEPFSQ